MAESDFSVAFFPFLKTSEPVQIGRYLFRCTTDVRGLPDDQAAAVSEIASMLFLRDDVRISRASYSIVPPLGSYRPAPVAEELARLRAVVAYLYSAPHPTSGDVFLSPETISLAVVSPARVSVYLVRPEHGTTPLSAEVQSAPDDRGYLRGYEGVYNLRDPMWLVPGSRLYGPKPQMTLNISQDLAADLGFPDAFNRPDGKLLLKLLCDPATPMSERIFTALDWYNSANEGGGDPSQSLLNLAVAFETLLQLPSSEKTDRLVDAISLLLGRTERLGHWAAQFYSARSAVAHEGRVRDWRFYASDAPKRGDESHPFGTLMTYGRQIFQLCVATVLVGADLAEKAGLREKFVANSERYATICKALAQSSKAPRDRLLEIAPLVDGLARFRFVASGGLTIGAVIGAVKGAAETLLRCELTVDDATIAALKGLTAATGKDSAFSGLAAMSVLAEAFKAARSFDLGSPERVVADLVELAWSDLFMTYYRWKEEAEGNSLPGDPQA